MPITSAQNSDSVDAIDSEMAIGAVTNRIDSASATRRSYRSVASRYSRHTATAAASQEINNAAVPGATPSRCTPRISSGYTGKKASPLAANCPDPSYVYPCGYPSIATRMNQPPSQDSSLLAIEGPPVPLSQASTSSWATRLAAKTANGVPNSESQDNRGAGGAGSTCDSSSTAVTRAPAPPPPPHAARPPSCCGRPSRRTGPRRPPPTP